MIIGGREMVSKGVEKGEGWEGGKEMGLKRVN